MQGKTLTEIVYGEDCFSFFRVADAVRVDREHRLSFGQTRRVVDLADSRLASAFAEVQSENQNIHVSSKILHTVVTSTLYEPCGGCMCHDVSADWLFRVSCEH